MTRGEAIELIERMSMAFVPTDQYGDYDDPEPYEEAINMAIEALQFQDIMINNPKTAKPTPEVCRNCMDNKQYNWIPVSERLPEGRIDVLVYSDVGHIIGYYDDVIGLWYGLRPFVDNIEVIAYAWQPLSEPYKEEKSSDL